MMLSPRFVPALFIAGILSICSPSFGDTGGPDSFGHYWRDSKTPTPTEPYSWVAIAPPEGGSGTEIASLTGQDDASALIPIGFDFEYYGITHTELYVSTNGFLTFASAGAASSDNRPIPQITPLPHDLIAAFWDDLDLGANPPTTPTPGVTPTPYAAVYYETQGMAPDRQLVVEWYGVPHVADASSRLTFQAILHEASSESEIQCQYNEMTDSGGGEASGTSATLGIEGPLGYQGLQYSFEQAVVEEGMAIRYYQSGAPEILVLQEICGGSPAYVVEALENMGLAYQVTGTADDFLDRLQNGGPWDLVIVDEYSNCLGAAVATELGNYVSGGGKAIICYWAWDPAECDDSALNAIFEASFVSEYTTPQNLYRWDTGHPIFTTPNAIPDFTGFTDYCDRDGAKFNTAGGGEAVAGYTAGEQANEAGIIIGNGDRTILNGEVFDVMTQAGDAVALIENEITYLRGQGPTPTPLPIVPLALMKRDQGGFDHNLYGYSVPEEGDWTLADAQARNLSPLARDLWQIPMNNNTLAITEVDADGGEQELAALKADQGGFDINLYLYNVPVPADWEYWDAFSRNPSPLARDFWQIPEGNDAFLIADGGSNIAAMKNRAGDYNLYLYESPYPGDWVYWDAFSRNPSPLARDFWIIPQGDDAVAMCGLDTSGDGDSDSLVVVRNAGGSYLLYLWNLPQAGDWTYWDALSRNPSPLARDFWVVPQRQAIADVAGIDMPDLLGPTVRSNGLGAEDVLSVMENDSGDYAFYLWNSPVPGDWTYWDAISRNPSPRARDLWQIPAGDNTLGMAAPGAPGPI